MAPGDYRLMTLTEDSLGLALGPAGGIGRPSGLTLNLTSLGKYSICVSIPSRD